MGNPVTFDDVRQMFQEMIREDRQRRDEINRQILEMRAENDRRAQENDRRAQENDRRAQETERLSQETNQKIQEVSRQIGKLGSRWGEFVEGLVAPACETLFAERNIPVHQVFQRVKTSLPGNRHMELDLMVVNTDTIIPVEVKSRLQVEDVEDFLGKLSEIKEFMPQYANMKVLGAVAGIVIGEGVDRFAMKKGLFVIVQSGKNVCLANPPDFTPRIW